MADKKGSRILGAADGDQLRFLRRLQWEKIAIWTLFVLAIFFLRKFFAAIFLTFIFGYMGHRVVRWICHKLGHEEPASKTWRVTLAGVFLSFAGIVTGLSWYVAPRIWEQGKHLHSTMFPEEVPGTPAPQVPPVPTPPAGSQSRKKKAVVEAKQVDAAARRLLPTGIPRDFPDAYAEGVVWVTESINDNIPQAKEALIGAVGGAIGFGVSFFAAFIFAFFILWDLPKLSAKVQTLGRSNLKRFYDEIAPGVLAFGGGLGQAFQAQTVIALLNTLLTLIGLLILGMPMVDVLSLIVFVCSFIPVLGVFISTVPIALIALAQIGPGTMLAALVLVLIIHFIEAYILNPRIYGHVMHMHPLIVLVILFIAEALFGLWGVLLGVPTCQFVFNYWIKRAQEKEIAASQRLGAPPPDAGGPAPIPLDSGESPAAGAAPASGAAPAAE